MKRFLNSPFGVGIVVFLAVLVLGLGLRAAGFHIQELRLVHGGDLFIERGAVDVRVFLDNKRVSAEDAEKEVSLISNISPGIHSVLAFNDAYWPWKKDVEIRPGETTRIEPFVIPKNPSGLIITQNDPEYQDIMNSIRSAEVPTKDAPLLSSDRQVAIWVEDNSVFAAWQGTRETLPEYFCDDEGACEGTMSVITAPQGIRDLDFYRTRSNVLLVAFANGVFAIEVDKRGGTQNFQPVYKGTELPRFRTNNENSLYVVDGSAMFIIQL